MATTFLRPATAGCLVIVFAAAAWGQNSLPTGAVPPPYPPDVQTGAVTATPAPGYPAGLPASPLRDLTPAELLTPPPPGLNGHADLVPPPQCNTEGGLFGSVEYLLLRPRREGLQFALLSGTTAPTPIGNTESLNFDLNSGVRVTGGVRLPAGWDAAFTYMYFRSSAEGSAAAPAGGILYPTLTRPGFVDSALVGSATAGVLLNVYDAEFGRRFELGESCSARIYAGFRFADVNQDFNAYYDGLDAAGSTVTTSNVFRGFGPIVGAEGSVGVGHNFSLYARASGGLLTGTSTFNLLETNQHGQSVYAAYESRIRKVVPVAGVGIGAGWRAGRLSIQGGYEITYWGSIVDSPRLSSDFSPGKTTTTTESLSLEGFFVRVGWQF
jgi:Legionella pneumophila major outer membrane protein precursor